MNFLNLNSSTANTSMGVFDPSDQADGDELYDCVKGEQMQSTQQFAHCLKYFLSKSILSSCVLLSFAFFTTVLNLAVIISINRLKQNKTVFDKIFIGHSFVDSLVGLIVIPNYCIYSVFGYWPLGKLFCHFYVSLDYTICHVGILHMVFIAYARLRSLQRPKQYQSEFLICHAKFSMFILWIISGVLWLPAVNLIINLTYKPRVCYFNFDPSYIILQDTVAYLLPMFIIIGITMYILRVLHKANKRRRIMRRKHMRVKNSQSVSSNANYSAVPRSSGAGVNRASSSFYTRDTIESVSTSFTSENNQPPAIADCSTNQHCRVSAGDKSQTCNNKSLSPNSFRKQPESHSNANERNHFSLSLLSPQTPSLLNVYASNESLSQPSANFSLQIVEEQSISAVSGGQGNTLLPSISDRPQEKRPKIRYSHDVRPRKASAIATLALMSSKSCNELRSIRKASSIINMGPVGQQISLNLKKKRFGIKLNPFAKLYVIIATFCVLWLPFCILWPINSICETCINDYIYELSYWMGYAQSLINPIMLLILNPNYKSSKQENQSFG